MVSTYQKAPLFLFDPIEGLRDPIMRANHYPQLRIMGNKHRLLPWLYEIFSSLKFDSVLDGFSGSGSVSYLFKQMGKTVITNDFLQYPYHLANGLIANPGIKISDDDLVFLIHKNENADRFIETTFNGIFFTEQDLQFLDNIWANLRYIENNYKKSLILSALFRSVLKKQPRGVFTIGNESAEKYNDGRRDLQINLETHFSESVSLVNSILFDNGRINKANQESIFDLKLDHFVDLVYFDPPYVPRSDDNDYIKRYHFLEGLACYWENLEIMETSKVRKIKKQFTPFSYRRTAREAFDRLFRKYADSIIVLSYSSNGYPDKEELIGIMKQYKRSITVEENSHRYHFGTHKGVRPNRAVVKEYVIIGA